MNCDYFAANVKKCLLWQDYGVLILPQMSFFVYLWQNKSCYGTNNRARKGKTSSATIV